MGAYSRVGGNSRVALIRSITVSRTYDLDPLSCACIGMLKIEINKCFESIWEDFINTLAVLFCVSDLVWNFELEHSCWSLPM